MAKAIVGAYADPRTIALLGEVRALRARVAALEAALEQAENALVAHEDRRVVELEQHDEHSDTARPLNPAGSVLA